MTEVSIEDWGMVVHGDEYTPPERIVYCLTGKVYGHPSRPDGSGITSAAITGAIEPDIIVTASGTRYKLGNAHPDYEASFPNAKQRLVSTITSKLKASNE